MAWDDLQVLEALARWGRPRDAARELGVAPSTVYRRLDSLEDAIGARCVVRGGSQVQLTEAGIELVALATDVKARLNSVAERALADRARVEGRVGLTTVEGFVPMLIEPLAALSERHPELRVDLHIADRGPSVWRRETDVAIVVVPSPPGGLVGRRCAPVRYGVFGTPEACARRPQAWVVTDSEDAHGRWQREHAPRIVVATRSRQATIRLVCEGVGLALLPLRIAARHAELARLDPEPPGLPGLERPVWLLTHPEVRERARVRALMDALLEVLV